jgi:hypothetical protein
MNQLHWFLDIPVVEGSTKYRNSAIYIAENPLTLYKAWFKHSPTVWVCLGA